MDELRRETREDGAGGLRLLADRRKRVFLEGWSSGQA